MATGGRDTGLQVVHYLSAFVTRSTPGITEGVRVGVLPRGALLIGARALVTQGWGGGRDLILFLAGDPPTDIATISVNMAKAVDNALDDVSDALTFGRDLMVRLDSAPTATGSAVVILTYLPKVG